MVTWLMTQTIRILDRVTSALLALLAHTANASVPAELTLFISLLAVCLLRPPGGLPL